jgi:dihydrofolate reductase
MARNGIIGRDNTIPWRLPEDLKRFRALTMGNPIIMGRRTWESLGRPLPGRRNLVVSRNLAENGCEVFACLESAIAACAGSHDAFIIGGASLYEAALESSDRLLLTLLDADFAGDTYFPAFDTTKWQVTERERHRAAAGFDYEYVTYSRVNGSQ